MLAAHSHFRWFLLFTGTLSRGTPAEASPGLLLRFPGRSHKDSWHSRLESDHGAVHCHYGILFLLLAALGFGMVCRYVDASWTLKSQFVRFRLLQGQNGLCSYKQGWSALARPHGNRALQDLPDLPSARARDNLPSLRTVQGDPSCSGHCLPGPTC